MLTPPVEVLIAFLRHPMTVPDGSRIYYCEFIIDQTWQIAISRRAVPIVDSDGVPMILQTEIGPGSIIRLSLDKSIIKAVCVIEHKFPNPFALLDS